MAICPHCSNTIDESAPHKFCPHCGAPLNTAEQTHPSDPQPANQAAEPATAAAQTPAQPAQPTQPYGSPAASQTEAMPTQPAPGKANPYATATETVAAPAAAAATAQNADKPLAPAAIAARNGAKAPSSGNKKPLIIAGVIVAAIIVVIAAVIAFGATGEKQHKDIDSNEPTVEQSESRNDDQGDNRETEPAEKSESEKATEAEKQAEPAEKAEVTEKAEIVDDHNDAFVGTWELESMKSDSQNVSKKDIALAKQMGMECSISFKKNGKATLVLFDEKFKGTWEATDAKKADVTIENATNEFTIKNGKLVLSDNKSKMVFSKK